MSSTVDRKGVASLAALYGPVLNYVLDNLPASQLKSIASVVNVNIDDPVPNLNTIGEVYAQKQEDGTYAFYILSKTDEEDYNEY